MTITANRFIFRDLKDSPSVATTADAVSPDGVVTGLK